MMHLVGQKCTIMRSLCNVGTVGQRIPRLARCYAVFPHPANLDPSGPPAIGFNYILNRCANIILNVTDDVPIKMLHVYPENRFLAYFGKSSKFEVSGYSDHSAEFQDFSEKDNYKVIDYERSFKSLSSMPHPSNTFQLIVCCAPVYQPSVFDDFSRPQNLLYSPPVLPLTELARVLDKDGYLLYGCAEDFWQSHDLTNRIMALKDERVVDFINLQKLPLPIQDLDRLPPHKSSEYQEIETRIHDMVLPDADSNSSSSSGANGRPGTVVSGMKYCLALLRKFS